MANRRALALVIPCLDDAVLLGRCLESFTSQTRPPEKIFVVDNGSHDNSAEVAASYGATVIVEPRRGITWAARAGYDAALAHGMDLIVRTDADAWANNTYLRDLLIAWNDTKAHSRKKVVGITGPARFDIPGLKGRVLSGLYLGAYRLSVGSALGHAPFFGTNCSFTTAWWSQVRDSIDPSDIASHDDIQLSFAVRADETVLYCSQLVIGMDARALRGGSQLFERFSRGAHSMSRGFDTSPPYRRLIQRATTVD